MKLKKKRVKMKTWNNHEKAEQKNVGKPREENGGKRQKRRIKFKKGGVSRKTLD